MRQLLRRACIMSALLCLFLLPLGAAFSGEPDFPAYYAAFQKAVASGDKNALADMSQFEGFTWEADGGPVRDRAVFLQRFGRLFTPAIKKAVATGKPAKVDDDRYCLIWHGKGLEYSFYFIRRQDGGFAFLGLTAGPE
jgi:hypothetical protein